MASGSSPLYQQIFEHIKSSIESGVYVEGDRLPSEAELCTMFSASRITVRRALGDLCTNGYLVKRQGVGTFVGRSRIYRHLCKTGDKTQTFTDICRENNVRAGARLLQRQIVTSREDETKYFDLAEGDLLLYIQRVRTADDVPIYEENIFLPLSEFRPLLDAGLDDVSMFGVIEQVSGRRVAKHDRMTIEAVLASPEQAVELQVAVKSPLLYMNAYFSDEAGKPLAIGRQYYVGSRYSFEV